jgi:mono/diheme cytochrome c family protein
VNRIPQSQFNTTDFSVGKALFVQKCGACHTLADAKTTGAIGPNLDDAFFADKAQGFHESTIADVVRGQIAYPDTNPGTGSPGMTANLLHGQQARDVAVYVAQCSANSSCGVTAATLPST